MSVGCTFRVRDCSLILSSRSNLFFTCLATLDTSSMSSCTHAQSLVQTRRDAVAPAAEQQALLEQGLPLRHSISQRAMTSPESTDCSLSTGHAALLDNGTLQTL